MIGTAITWLVTNRNKLIKAILGLSVAFLLALGITLSHRNKKLSESLETALNNIEAYLGSLAGSLLANNVLRLTVDELLSQNDKLLNDIDSVAELYKIKIKNLRAAATQVQTINVNQKKELGDSAIEYIRNNVYKDSIKFNDLTTVSYSIDKDSITIGLDIRNKLFLHIHKDRHYKNKKNFILRLFTLDFKKITTELYIIINTNPIIKTDSVRVIEITEK